MEKKRLAIWREMGYNEGAENKIDAGVLELVDEVDSKSIASDGVRVRVPPPAPKIDKLRQEVCRFPFGVYFLPVA